MLSLYTFSGYWAHMFSGTVVVYLPKSKIFLSSATELFLDPELLFPIRIWPK